MQIREWSRSRQSSFLSRLVAQSSLGPLDIPRASDKNKDWAVSLKLPAFRKGERSECKGLIAAALQNGERDGPG